MAIESTAHKLTPVNSTQADAIDSVIESVDQVLLGKDTQVRLALACLIARGHLLIEDLPGMGKTLLAHNIGASTWTGL